MYTELDELRDKAALVRTRANTRLKELYHYARSKGFSASESMVLMGRTREYIDRLAQEREVEDGTTT